MSVFLHGLAVVALLLSGSAAQPGGAESQTCPAIDPPAPSLRVFGNPTTRRIRPPAPGESAMVRAAPSRESRAYPILLLPDGTKLVELDDTFLSYVVVEVHPSGTVKSRCVTEGSANVARPFP